MLGGVRDGERAVVGDRLATVRLSQVDGVSREDGSLRHADDGLPAVGPWFDLREVRLADAQVAPAGVQDVLDLLLEGGVSPQLRGQSLEDILYRPVGVRHWLGVRDKWVIYLNVTGVAGRRLRTTRQRSVSGPPGAVWTATRARRATGIRGQQVYSRRPRTSGE